MQAEGADEKRVLHPLRLREPSLDLSLAAMSWYCSSCEAVIPAPLSMMAMAPARASVAKEMVEPPAFAPASWSARSVPTDHPPARGGQDVRRQPLDFRSGVEQEPGSAGFSVFGLKRTQPCGAGDLNAFDGVSAGESFGDGLHPDGEDLVPGGLPLVEDELLGAGEVGGEGGAGGGGIPGKRGRWHERVVGGGCRVGLARFHGH